MINGAQFSFFLFFLIFSIHCKAQNSVSFNSNNSITTQSYSIHFQHLSTNKGDSRKVIEGFYQEAGHEKARQYITTQLEAYCGKFNVYNEDFSWNKFKNLSNVIGVQYGNNPKKDGIWIIGAHYDSNNNRGKGDDISPDGAPGANDNASGISAMLEIARVLKNYKIGPTIIFAAWDLEERFFKGKAIGSTIWIKNHLKEGILTDHDNLQNGTKINPYDIKCNINIDMIGRINNKNKKTPEMWIYSGIKKNEKFSRQYTHKIDSIAKEIKAVYKGSITYSDHYSFASIGIPSVENAEADLFNDKFYHTYADHIDNPENLSYSYAAQISQAILTFILNENQPLNFATKHLEETIIKNDSIYFTPQKKFEKLLIYDSLGTQLISTSYPIILSEKNNQKNIIRVKTRNHLIQLVP